MDGTNVLVPRSDGAVCLFVKNNNVFQSMPPKCFLYCTRVV